MTKPIFIAGEWKLGRGPVRATYFPADGSLNAEIATASAEDVEEAVQAAERAWRAPQWRNSMPHERAAVLYRVADLITQRVDELAAMQTRDNGKPLAETRGLVMSAAATARYFAAACETLDEQLPAQRSSEFMTLSVHEPLGVIAAITPWNSPIASEMQKIAPALAGGNAVVLKPADATPLAALALAELFEEAGLPKGLLSVLPGRGSVVGEALAAHPLVRKISFTGGTGTGRHLAHVAAEKLIPTSLELGGKSPTIVFDDADLELAAKGVAYGIFSSSGQACIAGSRLFVHASVYGRFLDRLLELTRNLRVGHPEAPGTHMGPLISEAHLESVAAFVEQAKAQGGEILCGGARLTEGDLARGSYYPPTIISGLSNRASVCQDEIFGPVLVVLKFDDEADLLAQANDSVFGLAAGIWSEDFRRAWRFGRLLEAGTIWINTYKKFSISAPFGGFKESGLGREKGRLGVLEYMQQKSLYVGLSDNPNPWCN
ncbi:aldehyde dehydrogenase [Marinobacterium sedimentorum]|uniref:aldehyde dehydrogenase n=1 Tax=Marinobacterium sedimentorum TaxID=2927804 RepID=UPI0020C5CAAB|nr:aldehyde dehydrogenase [Marinobacterium sedimentorum]MCP8687674.1 aldehyde dehydrogenase [Marinobacterium sedimentorum]